MFTSGCALPQIKPDVADNLKQSKVAAAVYLKDKNIEYNELVYKVLWNETRTHVSDFTGLWDVDGDMTNKLVSDLTSQGIDVRPIRSILSDEPSYSSFVSSVKWGSTALNFEDNVLDRLKQANVQYLLLLRGERFLLSTTTFNSFGGLNFLGSTFVVYSLADKSEAYRQNLFHSARVDWDKSPREIEMNGMAKVKAAADLMATSLVDQLFPKVTELK